MELRRTLCAPGVTIDAETGFNLSKPGWQSEWKFVGRAIASTAGYRGRMEGVSRRGAFVVPTVGQFADGVLCSSFQDIGPSLPAGLADDLIRRMPADAYLLSYRCSFFLPEHQTSDIRDQTSDITHKT